MSSDDKLARIAALLFVLFVPMMNFGLVSHGSLAVDDFDGLAQSIEAGTTVFRVGTLLGAIGYSGFLVVGLLLYQLFRAAGTRIGAVMLVFVVAAIPFMLAAFARRIDIIRLLEDTQRLPISSEQWYLQIVSAHRSVDSTFNLAMFFWAPWGAAFGWLIFRSGFVPRVLGALLVFGSVILLVGACASVLNPSFPGSALGRGALTLGGIPTAAGEYGTIIWLLIFGTGRRRVATQRL